MIYKIFTILGLFLLTTHVNASASADVDASLATTPKHMNASTATIPQQVSPAESVSSVGGVGDSPSKPSVMLRDGESFEPEPSPTLTLPQEKTVLAGQELSASAREMAAREETTSPARAQALYASAREIAARAETISDHLQRANLHKEAASIYSTLVNVVKETQKNALRRNVAKQLLSAAYALHEINPREPNAEASELSSEAAGIYSLTKENDKDAAGAYSNAAAKASDMRKKIEFFDKARDLYARVGDTGNAGRMEGALAKVFLAMADLSSRRQEHPTAGNQEAADFFKNAAECFVSLGKNIEAAGAYENAADKAISAQQKIRLCGLSSNLYRTAGDAGNAQKMGEMKEKWERSLAAHQIKKQERANNKMTKSGDFFDPE